jgi:FG-GAP-like repeat
MVRCGSVAKSRWGFVFLSIFLFLPPPVWCQNNPRPLINSISPSAAGPGATSLNLTVMGENFLPGSVVNWNGSPRTTTFNGVTKLSAAITTSDLATESTANVTVTNPAPGGGISNSQAFAVVSPASQVAFSSIGIVPQVDSASNVVQADFNKDGKLDLAITMNNLVYVLLGNGDGTFQANLIFSGPPSAVIENLYVADVNSDGNPDLYVTGNISSTSSIFTLFGNGDGTFQAPIETDFWNGSSTISDFVFADFNKDGLLDAAFVADANQIVVLYGNPDGSFRPGAVSTVTSLYGAVRVLGAADFTGQGSLSLVLQLTDPSGLTNNFIGIFTGSNGNFNSAPVSYPEVGGPYAEGENVVIADFNGDGFLDIATLVAGIAPGSPSYVDISLNTGNPVTPVFAAPYTVPGATSISQTGVPLLLAADFNGDGALDLAAAGLIFFGKGDGTFPTSSGGAAQDFLVVGDFNNDGRPDLIAYDFSAVPYPMLDVLLQTPSTPDFSGSLSSYVITTELNNASNLNINLQAFSGFSSNVSLSLSGLPVGVTPTLTPGIIPGGNGSASLALAVADSVALGSHTVTVTATGGGITHTFSFILVISPFPGTFTGSITPGIANVVPGQSAIFTITVVPIDGFTETVSLTLSGSLPAGSSYSFSSPLTSGGGTSTLAVNIPSGLSTSSVSYLTITGTSGTISKSKVIAVNILAGPIQHVVHLTWNSSPSQVAGYIVYRSNFSGGSFLALNTVPVSALSYDDSTVVSGSTYYYVVTAVDSSGSQSIYSNMVNAVIPYP